MKRICYIVGSGDFTARGLKPQKDDFVIAADGGYRYLLEAGIKPDLLVGDFDSLDYVPENVEIFRFPSEKDDTDMGLAIHKGIELGYGNFVLYAGSGSRADHFFANIQLLHRFSEKGCNIRMVCPDLNIYAVRNHSISLKKEKGCVFSVFSLSDKSEGVFINGAKYNITNVSLSSRFPLGVSNEFIGTECTISVKKGVLLIFEYLSPDTK